MDGILNQKTLTYAAIIVGGLATGISILAGGFFSYIIHTRNGRRIGRKQLFALFASAPNPLPLSLPFEKRVQPHGSIEKLADGLWIVRGTLPGDVFPKNYMRVMVIYRPPGSDSLMLFSSVCLDEAGLKQLDELGKVTHIYVPCSWHTFDVSAYKTRYPNAKVVGPQKAISRVEGKTVIDVASESMFQFYNGLSDRVPANKMESSVKLIKPEGVCDDYDELTLLLDLPGNKRAVLINDLLFNNPPPAPTTFQKMMGTKLKNERGITTMNKVIMIDEFAKFRSWMNDELFRILRREEVEVLTFSHGEPLVGHGEVVS